MQPEQDNRQSPVILTPDQRLRVFISSTMRELAEERAAVRRAVSSLLLYPVMFELGARTHPPRNLYRAYLEQSHIFIGLYWQSYGWVGPGMEISGLEDEFLLSEGKPRLIYIKTPAPEREPGLKQMLQQLKEQADLSYKYFSTAEELAEFVQQDLALLLTERFEQSVLAPSAPAAQKRRSLIGGRLPILPRPLIGREQQLEQLVERILEPADRLVSLIGPGGVGKTSLALEAATLAAPSFQYGAVWVPLAAIRTPELVLSAIAKTLDVRERGGASLFDSLLEYMADKELLLVLDNFEQVLPAAVLVADLLSGCPKLTVLVTSRAPLRLRGEQEFPVPPLELPQTAGSESQAALDNSAAVRLFVDRARAVQPAFSLTRENAPQVYEIVRCLEGIPLAIELAAARVRMLPPAAMLPRLASRLDLLTGGARDLPERQQTMRRAIDWSYDLLPPQDRIVFAHLGVFAGGFDLEAVEAICNPDEDLDVMSGLDILLENNLVRQSEMAFDQPRFEMLEVIREYALEKLQEGDDPQRVLVRHADYYAELAQRYMPHFYTGEGERWLDQTALEYDNLRAAFYRVQEQPLFLDRGWKIMLNLPWFWYRRGYLNEARQGYELALGDAEKMEDRQILANLQVSAGAVAMWQSDLARARELMTAGLEVLQDGGDPLFRAVAFFLRGVLGIHLGEFDLAVGMHSRALKLFKEMDQLWFQSIIQLHMGNAAMSRGDLQHGLQRMQQALELGRQVGDEWLVASAVNNFGEIARLQGDYQAAEGQYRDSLRGFQQVHSYPDIARETHSLGYVALAYGETDEARNQMLDALYQHRQLGVKRGVAESLAGLAGVQTVSGMIEQGVRLFGAAQERLDNLQVEMWPADRQEFERYLEMARQKTDDQRFQAVFRAGRRMKLTEVLQIFERGA